MALRAQRIQAASVALDVLRSSSVVKACLAARRQRGYSSQSMATVPGVSTPVAHTTADVRLAI